MAAESSTAPVDPGAVSAAVARARRGLRSDVQVLVDVLARAELLVPLRKRPAGVELGEPQQVGEELRLEPHLLADGQGRGYCALFSAQGSIEAAARAVGWTTDGGDFEFCALPAPVALDLALEMLDEPAIAGLVLDAVSEHELMLRRDEVATIAKGRALPLVGYVSEIPPQADEQTLVAELEGPPPAELVEALDACLGSRVGVGYRLIETFNAERDTEPHLTLELRLAEQGCDRAALEREIGAAIEGKVPPPGYLDIILQS